MGQVALASRSPHSSGVLSSQRVSSDAVVGLAETGAGVQHAQPGVHRAVAHAEDPAVAGQQVRLVRLAVPQLQPRLQVVVVALRAAVVAAHGHAQRPAVVAVDVQTLRELAGHALAGEDQRGVEAHRRLVLRPAADTDDAAGDVEDGLGDADVLIEPRPRTDRLLREQRIEVGARADEAERRETGQLGPVQVQPLAAADDAQAAVVQPAVGLADVDAHVDERAGAPRGQPVAADLLAREGRLLDQRDIEPGAREPVRRAAAARAGADHDDVGTVVVARDQPVDRKSRLRGAGRGGEVARGGGAGFSGWCRASAYSRLRLRPVAGWACVWVTDCAVELVNIFTSCRRRVYSCSATPTPWCSPAQCRGDRVARRAPRTAREPRTASRSMTKTSVFPDSRCPPPAGPYASSGGIVSWRRPPTFMPGMPSCQPWISPRSGNSIDCPRFHDASNSSPVSNSTPT